MSEPPNLLKIPDDVMRIILEHCDYFGIQSLRKVCHHLRNFIDDIKPSPNTVSLGITVAEKLINFKIESKNSKDSLFLKYQETENPNFVDSFFADFRIFMEFFKSQKSPLENFSINFSTRNTSEFLEIFEKIGFLKTKKVFLRVFNESEAFGILKMLDSNFLETIKIENSTWERYILQMSEISNLEQWKNAKIAEIYRFDIWSPAIFSNFEKSKGYCIDLAPEDVVLLKEKFLANPNFKKCKIHYQRLENGVFEAIGENPMMGSDDYGEKRIWLLDTVDPDKILRIEHSEEQILTFSSEKNIFKILETLDLF